MGDCGEDFIGSGDVDLWVGRRGVPRQGEGEHSGHTHARGHRLGGKANWSPTDMFLGEYEHTIDAKGRMAVPARFRGQLQHGAVISKGMGTCLSVYTMQRWEEKSAELVAGKTTEELRDFERRIYPSASEVELDGQGRLVIPAKLRTYAGLDSNVTVAGVRDHFEIWDRATWQDYQKRLDEQGNGSPF